MVDRDGDDLVAVAAHRLAGLELGDPQRVAQAAEGEAQGAEQLAQAARAVDRQRAVAVAQVERLQQARQPEPVVQVEVRDEDVVEVGQADGAHELALRALAAVEQDAIPAAAHQHGGQTAPRGGHRAGRAGEEDGEIHRWASLVS